MAMRVRIHTDGGARGNPGPAGIGVAILDPGGRLLAEVAEYLGEATNNVAEYSALIRGLERALELGATEVEVRADSELMVRQMLGEYKVKHEGLKPLHARAQALKTQFAHFDIAHVRREQNAIADALANKAIDAGQ